MNEFILQYPYLSIRRIPLAVNGVDKTGVPYFHFDKDLKESYLDNVTLASKWQLQIGVRYIF